MRQALVTDVSHRAGIDHAVAERLRSDGLEVVTHEWPDGGDVVAVFGDPLAPAAVIEQAAPVDVLVVNHAAVWTTHSPLKRTRTGLTEASSTTSIGGADS